MSMQGEIPDISDELAAALQAKYGTPQNQETPPSTDPPQDEIQDEENEEVEENEELENNDENNDDGENNDDQPGTVQGYSLRLSDGSTVTVAPEVIESYYQFEQRLRSDQAFQRYLASYDPTTPGNSGEEGPPTPPPPKPDELNLPDDLDLEDPNIKFLVDTIKDLKGTVSNLYEATARHEQVITSDQRSQADQLIAAAKSTFQQRYDHLTDDDLKVITDAAARTGIVATYMSGVHPTTGLPVSPDPMKALELAMETAYWAIPEYRNAALANQQEQQKQERVKKRKASALSGNAGSSPRSAPAPANDRERRAAMTALVAADMGLE